MVNNAAAARYFDVLFADMTRQSFFDAMKTNVWAAWKWLRQPYLACASAGPDGF